MTHHRSKDRCVNNHQALNIYLGEVEPKYQSIFRSSIWQVSSITEDSSKKIYNKFKNPNLNKIPI